MTGGRVRQALVVMLAVAALGASGQAQQLHPAPVPASGGPRVAGGIGIIGAVPVGDFGRQVEAAGGVLAHLDARLGRGPLRLGGEIGYREYGHARRTVSLRTLAWSRLAGLRLGGEIILTVRGSAAATRRLLHVHDERLVILDINNPSLPADVGKTLAGTASERPLELVAVRPSTELRLARGVRVTQTGVFLKEQRVADLVRTVPRDQVADVRVMRKHVGTHSRRGFLIGAGAGALFAASCESDCPVAGLAALGALGGGVYGLEFGAIVGLLPHAAPT